jgi:hypothetical protein
MCTVVKKNCSISSSKLDHSTLNATTVCLRTVQDANIRPYINVSYTYVSYLVYLNMFFARIDFLTAVYLRITGLCGGSRTITTFRRNLLASSLAYKFDLTLKFSVNIAVLSCHKCFSSLTFVTYINGRTYQQEN